MDFHEIANCWPGASLQLSLSGPHRTTSTTGRGGTQETSTRRAPSDVPQLTAIPSA